MPSKTLVCRCEDVTLHELEGAVARGYKDIESVKRYTGFGTGWCQGKWCLALCARLLHERGGEVAQPITPRPPYHPIPLATLAGLVPLDLSGGGPAASVRHEFGNLPEERIVPEFGPDPDAPADDSGGDGD